MERRVDVFFYGLFMDADVLRAQGFDPRDSQQASVAGMGLRLGARAMLVPETGGRAHGMLMALTHAEIDRLYAESSDAAYRAEPITANLKDGGSVEALCFNLPAIPPGLQSNPDYAAKLAVVARRLGLPEEYMANMGRI